MVQEAKDIRLVVEIKNREPIELIELTKSLIALGNQFSSYVAENGDSKENREAKLYVKEIKTGSVILDLIEYATVGALPFIENVNTIIGFATYLKLCTTYFLKNEGEKPKLSIGDLKELSQIISPIAHDSGSEINVNTTINGNVEMHVHLNSIEANALQNIFKTEIDSMKIPEHLPENKNVLFYWHQAKSDLSSDTGNKGIIESISTNALKTIFEPTSIKEDIIKGETNPFTHAYIVDVKVETINGKPALYKITKIIDTIERTD